MLDLYNVIIAKILSGMEIAPLYKLLVHCLQCLHCLIVYIASTAHTVYTLNIL